MTKNLIFCIQKKHLWYNSTPWQWQEHVQGEPPIVKLSMGVAGGLIMHLSQLQSRGSIEWTPKALLLAWLSLASSSLALLPRPSVWCRPGGKVGIEIMWQSCDREVIACDSHVTDVVLPGHSWLQASFRLRLHFFQTTQTLACRCPVAWHPPLIGHPVINELISYHHNY